MEPERERPWWPWYVLILMVLVAAAGYATRDRWRSWLPEPAAPLHLQAFEREGQLLIQWDRNTRSVEQAQSGSLEITDGSAKTVVLLDDLKLRAGSFTYVRRTEIVELHLTAARRDGRKIEEYASFLGPPVAHQPTPQEVEAERNQLAEETAKVRADLKKQQTRTRQLERNLEKMRKAMREERMRRLENQTPPKQ
jgi:hypothetical protein